MNRIDRRESAEIFQFPTGGRAGLAARAAAARKASEAPPHLANLIVGNWYHEEAVRQEREEDRGRTN